jgi:two-component sensor histidine kinase
MSFIHESLYRSTDFSEVNFSEYINEDEKLSVRTNGFPFIAQVEV